MAILFTFLLGMAAILLGYFLYDFNKQNFIRETEAAIDIEMENILAVSAKGNKQQIADYIRKRSSEGKYPIYFYKDKDGSFLAGNIKAIPDNITPIKEGVISFNLTSQNQDKYFAAKIYTFKDGSSLLVARDVTEIIKAYNRLFLFSALIIGFMLLVILISFFISMFVVTRINKIANTAKEIINTGDISRRIDVDSKWDDLSYLSNTLNELLSKIESLMQGIRNVSDNIAHDLRTPITRLRGELEKLKNKKLADSDIEKLVGEADNILNIFNSLLRIANIEKGKRYQSFAKVSICEVLQDVMELYEPLAEERNIIIKSAIGNNFIINGGRDLLFQMFANLLDNAIKFSQDRSSVLISQHQNEFIISDNGIGIADEEREKVFDRFYRSDKSRNKPGSGLGLSMVKAITDLHNAKIVLDNNNPGLKVVISFS